MTVSMVWDSVGHQMRLAEGRPLERRLDVFPARIELTKECLASLSFVQFADLIGRPGQTGQRAQETTIGLVLPPDMSAAPPTALTEAVEAPVVTDPIGGVRLDRVAAKIAEGGPSHQARRVVGHHCSHGLASIVIGQRQGLGQTLGHGLWFRFQNCFG